MVAFGLGDMPGADIASAADIISGECSLVFIPQLPARGVGSQLLGQTLAMLKDMPIDARARTWVLTARPQRSTWRTWDRLEADLDTCQAIWPRLDALKFQVLGPWSLAASIELSNGHKAITDTGALRDITESFIHGIQNHCADLSRRFDCRLELQIDEPKLPALAQGTLPGATDFDVLPAIPEIELGQRLHQVVERLSESVTIRLNSTQYVPLWQVVKTSGITELSIAPGMLHTTAHFDGLGDAIAHGCRIGLGITHAGDSIDTALEHPRTKAQAVARLWDKLGFDRSTLAKTVDIHTKSSLDTASLMDAAAALRMARVIDEMITRDAGDL